MNDLIKRCAGHGWGLTPDDAGFLLTGNGAPAWFSNETVLRAWLDKQDRPKTQAHPDQLPLFDEDDSC